MNNNMNNQNMNNQNSNSTNNTSSSNSSSSRINVPQARQAMDQFKMQAANDEDVPSTY